MERARLQSQKDSGIELVQRPHVRGAGSKVTHRYHPVRPDLPLDGEVPLCDLHIRGVGAQGCNGGEKRPCGITRSIFSEWYRKWISPRIAGVRIVETYIVQNHPWSPGRSGGQAD